MPLQTVFGTINQVGLSDPVSADRAAAMAVYGVFEGEYDVVMSPDGGMNWVVLGDNKDLTGPKLVILPQLPWLVALNVDQLMSGELTVALYADVPFVQEGLP